MNTLSWFFYLAGLVEPIQVFLGVPALMGGVLGGVVWSVSYHDIVLGCTDETTQRVYKISRRIAILSIIVGLMAVAIPSKHTIYLMAASEIGEDVIKSPEGKEFLSLLKRSVEGELKELAE